MKLNNIKRLLKAENKKNLKDTIQTIKELKISSMVGLPWYIRELAPKNKSFGSWSVTKIKAYLVKRANLKYNIKIANKINEIEELINSKFKPRDVKISIEWKKSAVWGNNPTASTWICGVGDAISKASGCGYCKESTVFAGVLNQIPWLKLALLKEKNKSKNCNRANGDVFGYGSGSGIIPHFAGGVGMSCYPAILETIGYKMDHVGSGKTYDCYIVGKIKEGKK